MFCFRLFLLWQGGVGVTCRFGNCGLEETVYPSDWEEVGRMYVGSHIGVETTVD